MPPQLERIPITMREVLENRKAGLLADLKAVQEAILALDANPDSNRILELLKNAGMEL